MPELSVVGRNVLRSDSRAKVLGKEQYCTDIELPGMLHMKALGSPYPHAKILSIDTSKAEKVKGVRWVVTDEDAPQNITGQAMVNDRTVLARGVVRYVGEPVAAVAAKTLESAQEAVDLIKIQYEELPAVFDVEEAAGTNPPNVVHPDFPKYVKAVPPGRLDPDRPNVFIHMKVRKGDLDKGFGEADLIVENKFSAAPLQHCALEPHGVIVRPESDGGLTLITGRAGLWKLRGVISDIFGIKGSKIRVMQQYVGGAFGGKNLHFEMIPTLLALKSGQPVRWVFSREEAFVLGGPREDMVLYIKDGIKRDGSLVAREMRVFVNAGAYVGLMAVVAKNCSCPAVSIYRVPNLSWDSYGCYTNTPPRGGMRGFGSNEVVWAIESNMDVMAEKLGMDPVDLRRKNILKEGEPQANGEITQSIGAEECLCEVSEFISLNEKSPPEGPWRKGKGLALGNKYSTAPTMCAARIRVTESENLILYHGADATGTGVNTVMAQIIAEEFGVSVDDVEIVFSDTTDTPYFADGSTSSRVTFNLGNAVRLACQDAKRDLFERAAKKLGVSPDELDTKDMVVYAKTNRDQKVRVSDLFAPYRGKPPTCYGSTIEGGEIMGRASYQKPFVSDDPETGQVNPISIQQGKSLYAFYTYVAKAVEVAVNVETGQIKVIRCCGAIDLGKAINPKMCEQQSEGGLSMGIGSTIYEEAVIDNGRVLNPNFTDYRMPSAEQMPPNKDIKTILVESAPHRDGPYGAKGFAEGAAVAMEPAIANAVYDAVGVRIKDLPVTAEKVLRALKERG